MNTKHSRFNTVEDMVKWVLGNTFNASRRYSIESTSHTAWDDPEAGDAWDTERRDLGWAYDLDPEAREQYLVKEQELFARLPAQHTVTNWMLREATGSRWRSSYIELSEELGTAINATWTKRADRYDKHQVNVGTISVPGILKRLGHAGMDKEIAAATEQEQNRIAKVRRNNARMEARKLAQEYLDLMDREQSVNNPPLREALNGVLAGLQLEE